MPYIDFATHKPLSLDPKTLSQIQVLQKSAKETAIQNGHTVTNWDRSVNSWGTLKRIGVDPTYAELTCHVCCASCTVAVDFENPTKFCGLDEKCLGERGSLCKGWQEMRQGVLYVLRAMRGVPLDGSDPSGVEEEDE